MGPQHGVHTQSLNPGREGLDDFDIVILKINRSDAERPQGQQLNILVCSIFFKKYQQQVLNDGSIQEGAENHLTQRNETGTESPKPRKKQK